MAGLTINPTDIATARSSGYSDAEIVGFLSSKSPEQFKEAKDAGYSDSEILKHFSGEKPAPSGVLAGAVHGVKELVSGDSETAKQFMGVGKGGDKPDPNYVPANITNGSVNPLNWNYSQIPQKIAEQAPGLGQDILAATAAAKTTKGLGAGAKMSALAGLAGGALSAWQRTAGSTAKEAAAERTGNPDAEPETQDKVRGGLTAAASSAVGSVNPLRFVPGTNKIATVGAQGALDAAKKYLTTAAVGAGAGAASDATTQAGLTVGTDKGLTIDPARTLEAGAGGMFTSAAMAAPRGTADVARASSLREFGGANAEATKNYATRLQTAGDGNLGNSKVDRTSHENVKSDIQNELSDAARNVRRDVPLAPDVDNALQRAQTGKPLTPTDIATIESGTAAATDGANAAYLARTMRVAQLAQERGSYGDKGWAGGISGVMDKNLGFLLNPVRLAGGTVATALGMHLLGLSNPLLAGSVAGAYGGARMLDGVAGVRSPAKTFAEHFADSTARLRMPQTPQAPAAPPQGPSQPWGAPRQLPSGPTGPQVAPPGAPPTAPAPGPWGPRPTPTTSVPPVAPPAAPVPPVQQPQISPMALSMLKQSLKKGLPPEPVAPAPATVPQGIPKDVAAQTKALMSGLAKVQKMKAKEEAAAAPKATKITKANGKVETSDPFEGLGGYEPIPNERLYPQGISPGQYAEMEASNYLGPNVPKGRRESYIESITDTATARHDIINAMKSQYPQYGAAFDGLLRQLYKIGSKRNRALEAINHYAGLLPTDAGKALKDAFKPQLDRIWQK